MYFISIRFKNGFKGKRGGLYLFISFIQIMFYIQNYITESYLNYLVNHISSNWVYFSLVLFFISVHGIFLGRKNIIIVLMSIELMLISIMLIFIFFSLYLDDLFGQISTLFILTVGASESAVGLSLIVAYYRSYNYY